MWPLGIVVLEPRFQGSSPSGRGPVGSSVSPFSNQGLDEPLGLAIGSGCVGLGLEVAESGRAAGLSPEVRGVGGSVVRHDALGLDLLPPQGGQSSPVVSSFLRTF